MPDSPAFQLDPSAACDACGCFGAYRFEGETLCPECYAGRGSCCSAEFSGRDAHTDRDDGHVCKNDPPLAPSDR